MGYGRQKMGAGIFFSWKPRIKKKNIDFAEKVKGWSLPWDIKMTPIAISFENMGASKGNNDTAEHASMENNDKTSADKTFQDDVNDPPGIAVEDIDDHIKTTAAEFNCAEDAMTSDGVNVSANANASVNYIGSAESNTSDGMSLTRTTTTEETQMPEIIQNSTSVIGDREPGLDVIVGGDKEDFAKENTMEATNKGSIEDIIVGLERQEGDAFDFHTSINTKSLQPRHRTQYLPRYRGRHKP